MAESRAKPIGLVEMAFAVVTLLFMARAFLPFIFGNVGDDDPISATQTYELGRAGSVGGKFQLLMMGTYVVTACLLLPRLKPAIRMLLQNPVFLMLMVYVSCSILWSVEPSLTMRRLFGLLGATGFAAYLATRYTPEEFLGLLGATMAIMVVASLVIVVVLPSYGIHHNDVHAGTWRGAFSHKNRLGNYAGLAAVLLAALWFSARRKRLIILGLVVLALVLLLMSGSRSYWVASAGGLAILSVLVLLRRTHHSIAVSGLLLGTASAIALAAFFLADPATALGLIDRNTTLTGRTLIWDVAINHVFQRPFLGHGYEAFWQSALGSSVGFDLRADRGGALRFNNSAHNGMIDIMLDLGLIGFLLYVAIVIIALRQILFRMRVASDPLGLWMPAVFGYLVLAGVPGSLVLGANNAMWVVFIVIIMHASNALRVEDLSPEALRSLQAQAQPRPAE